MSMRLCREAGCGVPLETKLVRYCPEHRASRGLANNKRLSKEKLARFKMATHEVNASRLASPIRQASVMMQKEVPAVLAIWEAMDALLQDPATTAQDLEALVDSKLPQPISHQAVQQIERRALMKLRKALGPTYGQFMAEGRFTTPSREYSVVTPPNRSHTPAE